MLGVAAWPSWWSTDRLVGLGRIEGEGPEEFAGGRVDDADVEVFDEEQNGGSGVGSPDTDLDHRAVMTQRDLAGFVDFVAADARVAVGAAVAGRGFRSGLIGDSWS